MGLGGLGLPCGACGCVSAACTQDGPYVSDTAADDITWIAQSFVAPSGGITLSKATWAINSYVPLSATLIRGVATNYPKCFLYSSKASGSSQEPDTQLAQLSGPTTLASNSWEFTASYSLTEGTRYWIVLINNGTPVFYSVPECPSIPSCCGEAYALRFSLGGAWSPSALNPADPFVMTIN